MQLTALHLFHVCTRPVNACGDYVRSILPVVLYGCETWSLILREEDRLEGGFLVQNAEDNVWTIK
jgi:hypothetical protein